MDEIPYGEASSNGPVIRALKIKENEIQGHEA
jgi:hypothetical protein